MARRRKPGFPNVVRIRLRQCGNASCSAAADEMPSPPGISMSSSATSGRLAIAARTTSAALADRPTEDRLRLAIKRPNVLLDFELDTCSPERDPGRHQFCGERRLPVP